MQGKVLDDAVFGGREVGTIWRDGLTCYGEDATLPVLK